MTQIPNDETPEQTTRRELVEPVRKWGPRLARAIFVLVAILIVVGIKFGEHLENNTNGIKAVVHGQAQLLRDQSYLIHTLQERQVQGCHRVNVERRQANIQNFADYKFFAFTIVAIGRSIEHPERSQTAKEHELGQQYLAGLRKDIAKKSYVPLTFCEQVANGDIKRLYEPPKPVSFAKVHGKPPETAFKLQQGQ